MAVEVKSSRSNADDIERGIYQCIKYKTVLVAEDLSKNNGKRITSHLVLQNKLPVTLLKLKNKLNVDVIDQVTPI